MMTESSFGKNTTGALSLSNNDPPSVDVRQ